ncbi:hypothetical protein SLE2022_406310 [Rubroshorea leprosula]
MSCGGVSWDQGGNCILGLSRDSLIASKDSCTFHPPRVLISDCRELLGRIPHGDLQHDFRESNMCDFLSKLGHSLDADFVVFDACSQGLSVLLMADMASVEYAGYVL